MFVGQRVRVTELRRHAPEDRSAFVGRDGTVVQRVNVPWDPETGGLWRVHFEEGETVFAENELVLLDAAGREAAGSEVEEYRETWGVAPMTVSMPFRRRFGAGLASGTALLAVLIFAIAGVLLIWAGIAQSSFTIGGAGAALIGLSLGAAAILVS